MLRIVGSSNLLGNPISVLENVGQGFYQLARDPLQGMLDGPEGFVTGLKKGVQGYVKGVVGSEFEALSSVTGGLYSVIKQTSGDKDNRSKN